MTSQLAKGFYPAPVGFKSWEKRQAEARLVAKREQVARLAEMKRQELEADFEIWVAELDDTEKRRRLSGTPFADQWTSKLAERCCVRSFSKRGERPERMGDRKFGNLCGFLARLKAEEAAGWVELGGDNRQVIGSKL